MKKAIPILTLILSCGLCVADYEDGLTAYKSRNFSVSSTHFEEFLKNSPDDERVPDAVVMLTVGHSDYGEFRKIIPLVEGFLVDNPDHVHSPACKVHLANAYMNTDKLDKAISLLELTIEQDPDNLYASSMVSMLGDCYYRNGQHNEAVALLNTFISENHGNAHIPNMLIMMGDNHKKLKQFNDALSWYDRLVDEYPNHHNLPWIEVRRAEIFRVLNDSDNADYHYNRLQGLHPETLAAKLAAEIKQIHEFEKEKDYDELAQYLESIPATTAARLHRLGYYKRKISIIKNDFSESTVNSYLATYRLLVDDYPNYKYLKRPVYHLYNDALKADNWNNIIKYGEILLSTFDEGQKPVNILYDLAVVYEDMGNPEKALELYQMVVIYASKHDARLPIAKSKVIQLSPTVGYISLNTLKEIVGSCGLYCDTGVGFQTECTLGGYEGDCTSIEPRWCILPFSAKIMCKDCGKECFEGIDFECDYPTQEEDKVSCVTAGCMELFVGCSLQEGGCNWYTGGYMYCGGNVFECEDFYGQ